MDGVVCLCMHVCVLLHTFAFKVSCAPLLVVSAYSVQAEGRPIARVTLE